jgi:hypothetical protein
MMHLRGLEKQEQVSAKICGWKRNKYQGRKVKQVGF